jgi:hypothetical protein
MNVFLRQLSVGLSRRLPAHFNKLSLQWAGLFLFSPHTDAVRKDLIPANAQPDLLDYCGRQES